jgi:hypothetical protein
MTRKFTARGDEVRAHEGRRIVGRVLYSENGYSAVNPYYSGDTDLLALVRSLGCDVPYWGLVVGPETTTEVLNNLHAYYVKE